MCTDAGTCQDVEVVVDGACSTDFNTGPLCANSFGDRFCDFTDEGIVGTCADSPAAGEPCPEGACQSDSFCQFEDEQVCALRASEGEPCNDDVGTSCDFELFDIEGGLDGSRANEE